MTRERLVETMALAAVNHLSAENEIYVGALGVLRTVKIDGYVDFIDLMSVVLTALETAKGAE